jgi:hypothetical protein
MSRIRRSLTLFAVLVATAALMLTACSFANPIQGAVKGVDGPKIAAGGPGVRLSPESAATSSAHAAVPGVTGSQKLSTSTTTALCSALGGYVSTRYAIQPAHRFGWYYARDGGGLKAAWFITSFTDVHCATADRIHISYGYDSTGFDNSFLIAVQFGVHVSYQGKEYVLTCPGCAIEFPNEKVRNMNGHANNVNCAGCAIPTSGTWLTWEMAKGEMVNQVEYDFAVDADNNGAGSYGQIKIWKRKAALTTTGGAFS